MAIRLDFILGCTASGKASLAHALARRLDAEIISVDAMKVYRRMDIGTAKPSAERQAEVGYHLLDVAEPQESFSVGRFVELAELGARFELDRRDLAPYVDRAAR